jgi:hypothetical protein
MRPRPDSLFTIGDRLAAIDRSSLRRFTASVPGLRRLLRSTGGCDRELLLQAAMRRTLRELSEASKNAARTEADPLRAEQLRVVSRVAMELALTSPQ